MIRGYGSSYRIPRRLVLPVKNDDSWVPREHCDVREARERESAHREERVCVSERECVYQGQRRIVISPYRLRSDEFPNVMSLTSPRLNDLHALE